MQQAFYIKAKPFLKLNAVMINGNFEKCFVDRIRNYFLFRPQRDLV